MFVVCDTEAWTLGDNDSGQGKSITWWGKYLTTLSPHCLLWYNFHLLFMHIPRLINYLHSLKNVRHIKELIITIALLKETFISSNIHWQCLFTGYLFVPTISLSYFQVHKHCLWMFEEMSGSMKIVPKRAVWWPCCVVVSPPCINKFVYEAWWTFTTVYHGFIPVLENVETMELFICSFPDQENFRKIHLTYFQFSNGPWNPGRKCIFFLYWYWRHDPDSMLTIITKWKHFKITALIGIW